MIEKAYHGLFFLKRLTLFSKFSIFKKGMFMLDRMELLFGSKIEEIKNKTVMIIGIGGVGSYAVEAIVRSGVEKVIIVDGDKIDITNLNRQLIALRTNLNELKVDVAEKRIKQINPNCTVIKVAEFINQTNIDLLFREKIDYVIDAIDTIETKKLIIKECLNRNIKFICSMGTANKIDPTLFEITDIRKTCYDPIAKILRKAVKELKTNKKVMVVYSKEMPLITNKLGSVSYVPSVAGLLCASYVINDIIGGIDG